MKLLGISGTNGAGKDTLAEWLAAEQGWLFISGSDILRDELKKRGQIIERENLRNLSAQWRRQQGLGALIDMAVVEFQRLSKKMILRVWCFQVFVTTAKLIEFTSLAAKSFG